MRIKSSPNVLRPPSAPFTFSHPPESILKRRKTDHVFSPAVVNDMPGKIFSFTPVELNLDVLKPTLLAFDSMPTTLGHISSLTAESRPSKKRRSSYAMMVQDHEAEASGTSPPVDFALPFSALPEVFQRDSPDAFGRWHCHHPGCNKTFAREYDRGRHMRKHVIHREAPSFRCKICGEAFGRLETLKRHQREVECTINTTRREASEESYSDSDDHSPVKMEGDGPNWAIPWLDIRTQSHGSLKKRNLRNPAPERPTSPPSSDRSSGSPAPLQSEDESEAAPQSSPPPSPRDTVTPPSPVASRRHLSTSSITNISVAPPVAVNSARTANTSSKRASTTTKVIPSGARSSRAARASLARVSTVTTPTKTVSANKRSSRTASATAQRSSTVASKSAASRPYPVRALRPTATRRASGNPAGTTTTHSCASCRQLLVDSEPPKTNSKSKSKSRSHSPPPMAAAMNLPPTWGPNAQLCLACSVQYARCHKRCTVCFYVPCEWEENERWCSRCKGGTWLVEKDGNNDDDEDETEEREEGEEGEEGEVIVERDE